MPQIYTADIDVSVEDELVTLNAVDPQFNETKGAEPKGWILDLKGSDSDKAILSVSPVNGSGTILLAHSRPSGGSWTIWTEGQDSWNSPAFDNGDSFEVEVQVEDSNGAIRHGSSHFHVRDTGGGENLT